MGAQLAALGPREHPVGLLRQCKLGLHAGQRALELLAQRAATAEDQRLDRADAHPHDLRDLRVGAALELAHHERGALVERKMPERALDVVGGVGVVRLVDRHLGRVLEERHLGGPPLLLPEALAADVVRDRDQPVLRLLRPLTALKRTVGVHERRLRHVLRVVRVAEHRMDVAVDVADVAAVDPLEGAVRGGSSGEQRSHLREGSLYGSKLASSTVRASPGASGSGRSESDCRPWRSAAAGERSSSSTAVGTGAAAARPGS